MSCKLNRVMTSMAIALLCWPETIIADTSCQSVWTETFAKEGASGIVAATFVWDDVLYVGGDFIYAGSEVVNYIARWDGQKWSSLGNGMNARVRALAVYDDGSGPALYAAGDFTAADGAVANRIAKWDGQAWSPLGEGVNGIIYALAVHDDGSGQSLYAGGFFGTAGGVNARRIARWNGSAWSAVGGTTNNQIEALASVDLGNGPALYAGGTFTTIGGMQANGVARWDGKKWMPLASGVNGAVKALHAYDRGDGAALYIGGSFNNAGGAPAQNIARWDGAAFHAMGAGVLGEVRALATHDDGAGHALYVTGSFRYADNKPAARIARFNGNTWAPLGSGIDNTGWCLASWHARDALIVGGAFTNAGNVETRRIAQWRLHAPPIEIITHPEDVEVTSGQQVVFTTSVQCAEPVTFRWRRNGMELDAPSTDTLVIQAAHPSDEGNYDAIVSNSCTQVITQAARLTITAAGPIGDLNGDGVVDVSDLLAVLNAWGHCPDGSPAQCPADVNGDGVIDVSDMLGVLSNWG